uniref:C-type lectin domain-containing protein n=1 Tax=Salarias fasciatus TaxID=181472 RepID=A0A672HJ19_SALFA
LWHISLISVRNLQRGGCPLFWYSFNGRCYRYFAADKTWADAELYCVSLGANLVSIHSEEEHNFVKSLTGNFDPAQGWTWIGLNDIHKDLRYVWSDGSRVNFVFWNTGEPSNSVVESCVMTNYSSNKKWNDTSCSGIFPFVCKLRKARPLLLRDSYLTSFFFFFTNPAQQKTQMPLS